MSDIMQKDEVCEGCLFHPFLFGEEPCVDCSRAFSGRQKDCYEKVGSPLTRKESVEPPVLSPNPLDIGEEWKDTDWGQLQVEKVSSREEAEIEKVIQETTYLAKLIDDHWGYISKLIDVTQMHLNPKEKAIAEFHYRTAAAHFWKHAMEYVEEKV